MSDIVETIPTPSQHKGSHQISINSGGPNLEANLLMSDILETNPTPSQHKGSHQISINSGDPNLEANLLMSDIVETIPTPSQHKGSHQISIDKYSLALNTSLPCFGNPPLPATEHLGYLTPKQSIVKN